MLIGVLADTHDELERTRLAVWMLIEKGIQALVHCGDITGRPIVEACSKVPLYFVLGNHDGDNVTALRQAANDFGGKCLDWGGTIELGGRTIAITHGHLTSDVKPLLAASPDYLLTGHFHDHADWRDGPTRRVCPGALHRSDTFTVATIDLVGDIVHFHHLRS